MRVFVIVYDVVLQNVFREVPVRKTTSNDERLQLLKEVLFEFFFLEKEEEVIEEEVTVLDRHTELNADSDERSVPSLLLVVLFLFKEVEDFNV